ncbi:MAG: hypothetical protein ACJA00_003358 [Myxococcota bacterium]|jgi:hypothetical protein
MDGRQVEFFVADVSANAWPAADVAAAYYGRASQENRFAQEDREVGLARIVSYDLPGQELATLAGLFLLNYRIARGFELEPPPVTPPQPVLRTPVVDKSVPVDWPRDPVIALNLRKLDWDHILGRRTDWTWDPVRGELRCPEGRLLELTTVRPAPTDATRTSIIFRRPCYGCGDCNSRRGCLTSVDLNAHKHLELTINMDVATPLRKRLERLHKKPDTARGVVPMPISEKAGLHVVLPPRFKPREARKVFEELFVGASMRVVVDNPAIQRTRLRLVATDDADRQGRRLTWTQRVAHYTLPEHAVVRLEIETDRELRRWLGEGC